MLLYLNGNALNINADDYPTLLTLLDAQGLNVGRFAVEVDGQLVPKSRLASTALHNDMHIEVVQAVGGG